MLDLVIRNGIVVDGTGKPGYRADVMVRNGKIAGVGIGDESEAKTVVDAKGKTVAPGFIDPHTHFDVQLLWDGAARPALEHGVTTVVPGNCSLSLAPLKTPDRPAVVGMFQQIEEMPPEAFTIAFDWTWESFEGYCAAIRKKLELNVAPLVGHSVIRLWVMGADSQKRAATPDEIKAMQSLLRESLEAGAVGMSTSFVDMDAKGHPVPSRYAQFAEIDALAAVLGEYGRMLQVVPEFYDTDITIARVDQLSRLSLAHGIPTTFSPLFDSTLTPNNVDHVMGRVEEQFARGARVWPQMQTRPIDISFSLKRPSLFLARLPSWMRVMKKPYEERVTALKDPEVVAKLVADAGPDGGAAYFGRLVIRGGDAAPHSLVGRTIASLAAERNETAAKTLIDVSLAHGLDVAFLAANAGHEKTDRVGRMLAHPLMHVGASDGGAHLHSFATYGDTGYLFSEFVRKSHHLSLERAVQKITSETADIWGLADRGRIARGAAADLVVFDADTIARGEERPVFDMPGGGMRYARAAVGIDTVVVNGEVGYASGGYTGAKAGTICT
jgi:N-acyl-D-aspartate/D-glutamate deacylase